jgi:hypothetical protein
VLDIFDFNVLCEPEMNSSEGDGRFHDMILNIALNTGELTRILNFAFYVFLIAENTFNYSTD